MDIKSFFKFEREDFSKESFFYFILALAFIVIVLGALIFYLFYVFGRVTESPKVAERSEIEKALENMGSPNGVASINVPEEVLNNMGEPNKKGVEIPEDVLKNLGSVSE